MRRIVVAFVVSASCMSGLAHAAEQSLPSPRQELSVVGALALPQGEFRGAIGPAAGGIDLHLLFAVGSGRAALGVDAQGLFYQAGPYHGDNLIIGVHGTGRLRRQHGPRRPFVEALAGFKGFSTDTRSGTTSYGVGGGLQVPLRPGRGGGMGTELIEVGVRYLRGGSAIVTGTTRPARTDALVVRVGMALQF